MDRVGCEFGRVCDIKVFLLSLAETPNGFRRNYCLDEAQRDTQNTISVAQMAAYKLDQSLAGVNLHREGATF